MVEYPHSKHVVMKKEIHPTYQQAKVTCACGNTFTVGSTMKELSIDMCSACHPFYTGKQKLVDTARRVERFQELSAKKEAASTIRKGKKVKRAKSAARKKEARKIEEETGA